MHRFLILGGFVTLGVLLIVGSFLARRPRQQTMVWTRGQTPTQDPRQTLNRGRIGTQAPMPVGLQTWSGRLVDAGCPFRGMEAWNGPPVDGYPAQNSGSAERAAGVEVPSGIVEAERADAMAHRVPDVATRQMDAGCAVTGATMGFGVYLPNGELKNFDEGGNTKAVEAFQHTPEGQAVMNGRARGAAPAVTVTGKMWGDKILVESLQVE